MSRISWQMCDIFEVSNCICDRRRVRTIGKIVKEMKWVMRTNESAETKEKCCHGKGISPKMSKDRGI